MYCLCELITSTKTTLSNKLMAILEGKGFLSGGKSLHLNKIDIFKSL